MTEEQGKPTVPRALPDIPELPPGTVIASYEIEQVAGWGGMGVVYRASQKRPLRTVALKVIRPELAADPEFRRRFEAEADIAASIEHPNVLPIYETGEYQRLLYMAMRFIQGTDLREWLLVNGPMPAPRAAEIALQVGKALDAAHANGLVHRDIKPGNILLSQQGGEDHVYLTDFGLTKRSATAAQFTRTGTWVGTVDYVAPEQIRGERIDARADVYSLGCVLYQLISGKVPFERDSEVSTIFAHLNEPPPSLGVASPLLDEVLKRAMAKDPNARYASAGDLGRAACAAADMRSIDVGSNPVAAGAAAPAAAGAGGAAGATAAAVAGAADAPPAGATPPPVGDPDATRIDESYRAPQQQPVTAPGGYAGGAPAAAAGATAPVGQAGGAPPLAPPQAPYQPSPPGGYPPPPTQPPAGAPGARHRPPWLIPVVGAGVLAIVAAVVIVLLVSGSNGKSDAQLVKQTVNSFWASSGPANCTYLTQKAVASFGGIAACHNTFKSTGPRPITGTQNITVNGKSATDTGFHANGHPWKISLVKQHNGKWLIDVLDDIDRDKISTLVLSWANASGSNVCNYVSQTLINRDYGGSLTRCQTANSKNNPPTTVTSQSISISSGTQATDTVALGNGAHFKLSVGKQSNGNWLIDQVTRQ